MTFAIITEYNPFHNGHNYQISKIKSDFGCDNLVVIMSGNFVQRGDVSIASKFTRTEMALNSGADLVIEIPQIFATSSAMYFSKGSISVLDKLGIVDKLCFGSENTTIENLTNISKFLIDEPDEYKKNLKNHIKKGHSYPKSRSLSLKDMCFSDTIRTPNNILGIEYIKSILELNSNIIPITINRTNNFHDKEIKNNITSATSIRDNIGNINLIKSTIPKECFDIFYNDIKHNKYDINNISNILHYILRSKSKEYLINIADMNEHIYNRLIHTINSTFYITEIIDKMVTKNYTKTRIQRVIINIILDNKKDDLDYFLKNGYPFVRVLGFKSKKQHLLKEIINYDKIKLVTNLKNAHKILNDFELDLLYKDINKTNYFLLSNLNKNNISNANTFENKLIIK